MEKVIRGEKRQDEHNVRRRTICRGKGRRLKKKKGRRRRLKKQKKKKGMGASWLQPKKEERRG